MNRPALASLLALCMMGCTFLGASPKTQGRSPHRPEPTPKGYYREQGIASWYGREFHHLPTATGETYNMYAMTAAHRTLPLGTWVTVTDLDTHRSVHVRINDRGPFVQDRIIDLSYGAARELGILREGTTRVEVRCSLTEEMLREELGYWVQLGAYQDRSLADERALSMREKYPSVRVLSSEGYHHVRIGPFRSEPQANRLKDLLREASVDAFVVRDLLSLSNPPANQDASQGAPTQNPLTEERRLSPKRDYRQGSQNGNEGGTRPP